MTILVPFGVGRDNALAFILVAQVIGYVVILALGLPGLYLLQGSRSLREITAQSHGE